MKIVAALVWMFEATFEAAFNVSPVCEANVLQPVLPQPITALLISSEGKVYETLLNISPSRDQRVFSLRFAAR